MLVETVPLRAISEATMTSSCCNFHRSTCKMQLCTHPIPQESLTFLSFNRRLSPFLFRPLFGVCPCHRFSFFGAFKLLYLWIAPFFWKVFDDLRRKLNQGHQTIPPIHIFMCNNSWGETVCKNSLKSLHVFCFKKEKFSWIGTLASCLTYICIHKIYWELNSHVLSASLSPSLSPYNRRIFSLPRVCLAPSWPSILICPCSCHDIKYSLALPHP